jgi:acetyl-CoA synthetase
VAVIAKPDPDRGAIVKALVSTRPGFDGDAALALALKDHVKTRLAGYKAPREVEFVDSFEMTSSGKINRRVLREAEREKARGGAAD